MSEKRTFPDSTASDCFVCQKHRSLFQYAGEPLLERGGLLLTHFPKVESESTTPGRLLIEPRRHVTDFCEMSDEEASALGFLIREGSRVVREILRAEHVYLFRINDKVAHLHFHLVPRYSGTPREFWGPRILEWPDAPRIDLPEIQSLGQKLRLSLV